MIQKSGQKVSLVKYDCIDIPASALVSTKRLTAIHHTLIKICQKHHPHSAAVENLFFNTNAKTAMKVGEARGAILIALESQHIPIFHYTPLQVKIAVTGYGRADKFQVQKMVKSLLRLDHIPKPDDAADALAVALTHAFTVKSPQGITVFEAVS